MSESTEGVYEMFWDCAFCGTTALLGVTNRHCPNCGAPQDETRRYFPPPGKEVVANTAFGQTACGGAGPNGCATCWNSPDNGDCLTGLYWGLVGVHYCF